MSNNRVHVVIPKELIDEVDSIVGQRGRSAFICEAAREKLTHQKQLEGIRKYAGTLKDENYPEWKDGAARWVHNLRQRDDEIRESRLRQSADANSTGHQRNHRRAQKKTRAR